LPLLLSLFAVKVSAGFCPLETPPVFSIPDGILASALHPGLRAFRPPTPPSDAASVSFQTFPIPPCPFFAQLLVVPPCPLLTSCNKSFNSSCRRLACHVASPPPLHPSLSDGLLPGLPKPGGLLATRFPIGLSFHSFPIAYFLFRQCRAFDNAHSHLLDKGYSLITGLIFSTQLFSVVFSLVSSLPSELFCFGFGPRPAPKHTFMASYFSERLCSPTISGESRPEIVSSPPLSSPS